MVEGRIFFSWFCFSAKLSPDSVPSNPRCFPPIQRCSRIRWIKLFPLPLQYQGCRRTKCLKGALTEHRWTHWVHKPNFEPETSSKAPSAASLRRSIVFIISLGYSGCYEEISHLGEVVYLFFRIGAYLDAISQWHNCFSRQNSSGPPRLFVLHPTLSDVLPPAGPAATRIYCTWGSCDTKYWRSMRYESGI
jgi:hypothetical protein